MVLSPGFTQNGVNDGLLLDGICEGGVETLIRQLYDRPKPFELGLGILRISRTGG